MNRKLPCNFHKESITVNLKCLESEAVTRFGAAILFPFGFVFNRVIGQLIVITTNYPPESLLGSAGLPCQPFRRCSHVFSYCDLVSTGAIIGSGGIPLEGN